MSLPIGIILLWRGNIHNIPAGWALCDGTLGTPDLRDQFIIGAGAGFNPDDSGGALTHTHNFTTDGHEHTLFASNLLNPGTELSDTTTVDIDTGTTNPGSSLPPYYALAYIMRV